jgi:hypothetical protein
MSGALDIALQRPWRLGDHWSAETGFVATVIAKGDGPPEGPGTSRRQGDLLLLATERTLATAMVAAHNALLDSSRPLATERDEARAEAERLRAALQRIADLDDEQRIVAPDIASGALAGGS